MSSPYRAASTRVDEPGKRWGATFFAKLLVRLFRDRFVARREEARGLRAYYRRLAAHEDEIRSWRVRHERGRGDCLLCDARPGNRCPMPSRPLPPPRRVWS